jgi:hypothetical protein
MIVADARRFVASRGARRSGIAAPLWHIWLPTAPLRQLASSYVHTSMHASRVSRCISCMIGESRIEYSVIHISHIFFVGGSTRIECTPVLFTGIGTVEFTGSRVHGTRCQHSVSRNPYSCTSEIKHLPYRCGHTQTGRRAQLYMNSCTQEYHGSHTSSCLGFA